MGKKQQKNKYYLQVVNQQRRNAFNLQVSNCHCWYPFLWMEN